jgi:hypothetical protein
MMDLVARCPVATHEMVADEAASRISINAPQVGADQTIRRPLGATKRAEKAGRTRTVTYHTTRYVEREAATRASRSG